MIFIYSVSKSSDELPISLVYLDTSINPNKLLGHVEIDKCCRKNDSLEFDNGTVYLNYSLLQINIKTFHVKCRI